MKKTLIVLLFCFCSNISYAQSQWDMTMESDREFKKADKELNVVYQKILTKYAKNIEFIKALRESERIWVKFRSAELNMRFPGTNKKDYGSVLPMCVNGLAEKITRKRIAELKQWLKPQEDGDVCTGSIGDTNSD
jgi:uncharacterized protein YecT (DUF1311 family)